MREPLRIESLARIADMPAVELERYRAAKLLDPDGDGELDELDILRLRILMHYRSLGHSFEDLETAIRATSPLILYADLLWGPEEEMVTPEGAAEQTGLDTETIETMLRATGLGATIPRDDVKFLEAIKGLVDGGIPLKMVLDVAQVYGDTLRRLAQTEVKMIREFVSEPGRSSLLKDREQSQRLDAVQQLIGPILEPLLLTIHRRHLLRASVQEAIADLEAAEKGTERDDLEATITFVDLASFTSLAQVHGDEVAADILDKFGELVRGLLDEHKGTMVKQIGDAFMLVFAEPSNAVRFAVKLDRAAAREPNFPALRTGIHSGPVLYRVGDYIGNTVNLAARIAAMASANEILLTEPLAHAAADAGVQVAFAGEHVIPGLEEPVKLWRVERLWGEHEPDRDPVCGMAVGEDAAARLRHNGVIYAFCSPTCLRRFLEDPDRYVEQDRSTKPEL
ncbi:MAG: adenylate/guanylate cyclase domain-containing protein [Actinomycetota bacterium]